MRLSKEAIKRIESKWFERKDVSRVVVHITSFDFIEDKKDEDEDEIMVNELVLYVEKLEDKLRRLETW